MVKSARTRRFRPRPGEEEMKNCGYEKLIGPYHDGELDEKDSLVVERHTVRCAACSARVESLRRFSRALSEMPAPQLSDEARERFHLALKGVKERVIARFAALNAAAAAAILIICSALLIGEFRTDQYLEPAEWESAAVTLGREAGGNGGEFQLAQWLIDELSDGGQR